MSDISAKQIPASVTTALEALEQLRTQDAALAERVQKILPGYAKSLEQRGEAVTIDGLIEAAQQGPDHLKHALRTTTSAPQDFATRYAALKNRHHEELKKKQEETVFEAPLDRAIADGDLAAIKSINIANTGFQQNSLGVAIKRRHLDVIDFILEKHTSAGISAVTYKLAARYGHTDIMETVYAHPKGGKAIWNSYFNHPVSAILTAAIHNHHDVIRLIAKHRSDLASINYTISKRTQLQNLEIDTFLLLHEIGIHPVELLAIAEQCHRTDLLLALAKNLKAPSTELSGKVLASLCIANQYDAAQDFIKKNAVSADSLSIAARRSIFAGKVDALNFLVGAGATPKQLDKESFKHLFPHLHPEIFARIMELGLIAREDLHTLLAYAAKNDAVNMIGPIIDAGADVSYRNYQAVKIAVGSSRTASLDALLSRGGRADGFGILSGADLQYCTLATLHVLKQHDQLPKLPSERKDRYKAWKKSHQHWHKILRGTGPTYLPEGLENADPRVFKLALFSAIRKEIKVEGRLHYAEVNRIAYKLMATFQSEDRLLQYLERWYSGRNTPLQNLAADTANTALPEDLSGSNLADWGDAILRHGPAMLSFIRYCDRLPSPAKSDDGKTWSLAKTRTAVARHAFKRAAEHPKLAELCFEYKIKEENFEKALKLADKFSKVKHMPEIAINGDRFDMEGATFRKLANDDVRGLFLGQITDCCQSIGGNGAPCAEHGYTSRYGAFYVVENAKKEIIGQTWAWRGTEDEICFDSLETLGRRVTSVQWQKLMSAVAADLEAAGDPEVSALHIGTKGGTPIEITAKFKSRAVAQPLDYTGGYRDSQSQVRVWKRKDRQP